MVQVVWLLEDAERPGGVESVVRSLTAGLVGRGDVARAQSWLGSSQDLPATYGTNVFAWTREKVRTARHRSRAARSAASAVDALLTDQSDAVVVLDPGSIEVGARLRAQERWGLHLHWDPDLLIAPWRHVDAGQIPRAARLIVALRLRWIGRRNSRVLRRAPFLVTITPSHTRRMASLGLEAHEIPNPVPAGVPAPRRRTDVEDAVIGYVGRLAWEKGPDVLLEAFRIVRDVHERWRLRFVGDGPMRESLESDSLSKDGMVEFRGWVDDVPSELDQMDVMVMPSRSEAMGLVAVEALGRGCAVVACDAGPGVRDVLGQGRLGRVVPIDSPGVLASAIMEAVEERASGDGPTLEEVAEAIRRYDPELVVSRWQRLLSGLLRPIP